MGPVDRPLRRLTREDVALTGDPQALAGLRLLLVDDQPNRALTLAEDLEDLGVSVVVIDGHGAGLGAARELDPDAVILDADVFANPASQVLERLRRDRRLRWAPLLVVPWSELDGFVAPLELLAGALFEISDYERELRRRATEEDRFEASLERTGPGRLLRLLAAVGAPRRVVVEAPSTSVEVDLAQGLVVSAVARVPGVQPVEGLQALRQLLDLTLGRALVSRLPGSPTANVALPLDEALARAGSATPLMMPVPMASPSDAGGEEDPHEGATPVSPPKSPALLTERLEPSHSGVVALRPPPPDEPAASPGDGDGVSEGPRPAPDPTDLTPINVIGSLVALGSPLPGAPASAFSEPPSSDGPSAEAATGQSERPAAGGPLQDRGGIPSSPQPPPPDEATRSSIPASPGETLLGLGDREPGALPRPAVALSGTAGAVDPASDPTGGSSGPGATDPTGAPPGELVRDEAGGDDDGQPVTGRTLPSALHGGEELAVPMQRFPISPRLALGGIAAVALVAAVLIVPTWLSSSRSGAPPIAAGRGGTPGDPGAAKGEPPSATSAPAPSQPGASAGAAPALSAPTAVELPVEDGRPRDELAPTDGDDGVPEGPGEEDGETSDGARAVIFRGELALRENDLDRARAQFEEALALEPDANRAMAGLARVAFRENRPSEALRWIDQALEWRPRRVEYHVLRGDVLAAQGDAAAAKRVWRQALLLDPSHRGLLSRLRPEAFGGAGSAQAEDAADEPAAQATDQPGEASGGSKPPIRDPSDPEPPAEPPPSRDAPPPAEPPPGDEPPPAEPPSDPDAPVDDPATPPPAKTAPPDDDRPSMPILD